MSKRLIYENAKKFILKNGQLPKDAILTQSFLRFEVPLAVGQTQYVFDTLVNENTNPNFVTQNNLHTVKAESAPA